jgi:hypothetical protein
VVQGFNFFLHRIFMSSDTSIRQNWASWRDIFEYLACVEFARRALHQLVQSKMTGGTGPLAAIYQAASLVFFGQAALDNIANWLARRFHWISRTVIANYTRKFSKTLYEERLSTMASLSRFYSATLNFLDSLERVAPHSPIANFPEGP